MKLFILQYQGKMFSNSNVSVYSIRFGETSGRRLPKCFFSILSTKKRYLNRILSNLWLSETLSSTRGHQEKKRVQKINLIIHKTKTRLVQCWIWFLRTTKRRNGESNWKRMFRSYLSQYQIQWGSNCKGWAVLKMRLWVKTWLSPRILTYMRLPHWRSNISVVSSSKAGNRGWGRTIRVTFARE